ncbi:cyclic diguanylate phosphodiesterase (EAL) domain-containing protein [Klebsiella pneumoniae]|uniref:Cyclic diguanylate phosphodiesterase (EAL) domain-containing protein n=1 Tax=Klebsiella pneumoniae TaxID=573 RepID=A0A2X3CBP3_KLEPN|nr:cyclic diguanylate phosphodiesterase (EAL) domain-containing protein [Klebsiella pneumoniae]
MRTRHLMALFTGVLILAIILPISLSIWQAARQAKMQFYRELDDYSNRIVVRTLQVADQAGKRYERLTHTPPPPVA